MLPLIMTLIFFQMQWPKTHITTSNKVALGNRFLSISIYYNHTRVSLILRIYFSECIKQSSTFIYREVDTNVS